MAETALSLVVTKEMLERLQKADHQITDLANKSEQASKRIISAFTEMGQKGVGAFINKLNEAQNKIASLNNIKIQGADFSQFTNNTTQAIDAVNRLTTAMNKVSKGSEVSQSASKKNTIFAQINEQVPSVITNIHNVEQALNKITVGDKTYSNSALTKINAEIDIAMKKLGEVNKMLQFYAKGEGKKAIGFVDTTSYQKEAKELMNIIDLLQRQRQSIIANAQLRIKVAQQQEAEANRYVAMENERRERIQANAKLESDLARKRTNDAKKSYEEQYKAYERMFDEIERRERKLAQQQAKNDSRMRKKDYERYVSTQDTYSHAMNVSNRAKTLNQEVRAIKSLEQARANLNKTDAQYEQKLRSLNNAILRHKQNIDKATAGSKNLQNAHRGLMNISEQLTRRLALVFSVSQITGYVNKLISVRGEFELQQRALQAILQNREEADKLWEKTIQLAVQSPFQVKELVTYTKQLAAYRVESDKLYDTTKMLADVSAGLGVDMQRLILAFGQVKAANYLRGTELRQFSEAGINILGKLATYFTELEGITVSVGEVFERVSKRMVTFGDVEEIFKRLTSAGGTFYRMQEIQAETLRGQISNLKDSIDIMLNEVGKANEQTLKNSVALVRSFVESWERIVDILQAAGAAYIVVTAARVKDAIATKAWSAANIGATASAKGLNAVLARTIIGLKALWAALMNNPITATIAGLTALGVVLYKVAKRNVEANRAFKESVEQLTSQSIEVKKYTDELSVLIKRQNELAGINKKLSSNSNAYKNNILEISKIEDKRKQIIENLNTLDATYAKNLKDAGTDISKLTNLTSEYNQELVTRIALERELKNLSSDEFAKKFNSAMSELNTSAGLVEASYIKTITAIDKLLEQPDKLSDRAKQALNNFKNSTEPFLDRFLKLHNEAATGANELWRKLDFSPIGEYIVNQYKVKTLFQNIETELADAIDKFKGSKLGSELLGVLSNVEASEDDKKKAKDNIINFFNDILDDKGIAGKLRDMSQKFLSDNFSFDWEISAPPQQVLEEWKVAYNDFIATLDQEKGARIAPATLDTTLEQLRSDIDSQIATLEKSIAAYDKADEKLKKTLKSSFEKDTTTLANLKKQRDFLGYNPKETTSGAKDNTWTNLMRVVKEVNAEFKNLNKTFDKTTALQGTLAKYSDALTTAFKGTGKAFTDFDFTTESGLIAFYDWLIQVIPEVDKLKAQLAKGEVDWDININDKELKDKALLDQIEKMFSGYEISLELQKLNIPKDWAKDFFGIETFDLSQISQKVEEEIAKIGEDNGQKYKLEKLQEFLKKVKEMEVKAQQERLKTYLQYARDAVGDRAKIKLEEMRKLQEIEETFTKPEQEEVKQKAIAKVRKDSEQDLNKLEWDEFQKSDTFINLFADLDSASSALIEHSLTKLREFKEQWRDMPMEDMRAIVQKINELEIALAATNPFEGVKELRDAIKVAERDAVFASEDAQKFAKQKDYASAFAIERAYQEERLQASKEEISDIETILRLKEEGQKADLAILNTNENLQQLYALDVDILKEMRDNQVATSDNAKKQINNSNNYLSNLTKQQEKLKAQADAISKAQEMANNLYDAFKQLNDVLGGNDSVGAIFADMGMQMMNTVLNTLMLQLQLESATATAKLFGIEMNAAMGVIGWIVMAVQLIAQVLGAIFAAHDKRLEKQIERLKDSVEQLDDKLVDLEKHIEKAFNVSQLEYYTKQVEKNIKIQIAAYQKMIALEEDKKKTDEDTIKGYQDTIKDLQDKLFELQADVVSKATSGILDDTLSAARGFVDAWSDSFSEVGDGMKGLESNFKEMLSNLIKQQASMVIAGNFLDRWKAQLDKYINKDDLELTTNEAKAWVDSVQKELPQLNEALETYFKAMEQAGLDLSDTSGDLSGLQAGIKSITEAQAASIEAYLNSIRFYVAQDNSLLTQLINSFTNTETPNPILSELRSQSEMIRTIQDMLSSVIGRGNSTHSGAYLKVAM